MTLNYGTVTQLVNDLSSGKIKRDPGARLRVPCVGIKQMERINESKRKKRMRDLADTKRREHEAMFSLFVAGKVEA